MPQTREEIIEGIEAFVKKHGGNYNEYYIGITNDFMRRIVEGRLDVLNEHLRKGEYTEGMPSCVFECESNKVAIEIERHFQSDKIGMAKYNPASVGVKESVFVYCYKMDEKNKEIIYGGLSDSGKETKVQIKKFADFDPDKTDNNMLKS